jgi:hypothetical protein
MFTGFLNIAGFPLLPPHPHTLLCAAALSRAGTASLLACCSWRDGEEGGGAYLNPQPSPPPSKSVEMAVLVEGQTLPLSSKSDARISVVYVKLTDSALRSLEEHLRLKVSYIFWLQLQLLVVNVCPEGFVVGWS